MSSTFKTPQLPSVFIVTPALASANNGNWHTAARWARMLRGHCRIGLGASWDGQPCDLLIALHARRSAESIARFAAGHPERPRVVVLTGTDLYRDIHADPQAQRSLALASHLVVLQAMGPQELKLQDRAKCVVIHQSAARLTPLPARGGRLRVVSVGHLRDEKDPLTFMRAAARLRARADIGFAQIGGALDPELGAAAQAAAATQTNYRYLGNLPRALTRQHIRRAHLLVSTSRMEGGAQVIIEAAQSGTAVLASRIAGNVGLLGADHPGLFELGDDAGLAALLERARDEPAFLAGVRARTLARAPLFDPAEEARALLNLVHSALRRPAP